MNKKPIILLVIIQLVISLLGACGQKGPLPPSDKIPPRVSLISPTNGAQSVPVNCSVVITFSEEMNARVAARVSGIFMPGVTAF